MKGAIGIFDSGIGGLTVAKAIKRLLPHESIIYFGDTAHLPYGDKSAETVRQYAEGISRYLLAQECKAIVIACNTASSFAYEAVKEICGPDFPVINVIDPVVAHVCANPSLRKVGVIGTKGTIASKAYENRILAKCQLEVVSQATPLLAPMIEEGFFDNNISHSIIENYLSDPDFLNIDALILGCTHYPLIKSEVQSFYGENTVVIDSSVVVAQAVLDELSSRHMLQHEQEPEYTFHVSDYTESFEKSTRIFFKQKIHLEEVRIWD